MNSIRALQRLSTKASIFAFAKKGNSLVPPSTLFKRRFAVGQETGNTRIQEIKPPITVLQTPLSEKLKFPSTHPLENLKHKLSTCTAQQLLKEKEATSKAYVVDIEENSTVYEAVKLMADTHVGAVIVKNPHSKETTGIFTERDYIQKLILLGRLSRDTLITQVMSENVMVAPLDFSLDECAKLMAEKGMRHLPIIEYIGDPIDEDYRVVGMISATDIIRFMVKNCKPEDSPLLKGSLRFWHSSSS